MDLVWYACYGSNLDADRFMEYIRDCTDRSPPMTSEPLVIDHRMYFAKRSDRWKGGVAFIERREARGATLGKRYLVSREQFEEVFLMENKVSSDGAFGVDLSGTLEDGEDIMPWGGWYNRLVLLDRIEGTPVITFTASWDDGSEPCEPPSTDYLDRIVRGLRTTHSLTDRDILEYLKGLGGIEGRIAGDHLARMVGGSAG
ncbi:MAG: hypothetical protein L0Z54_03530 [Thermoplasmata archaeon]|nr:hypothetical protein [Thermoplasmata archaeon]